MSSSLISKKHSTACGSFYGSLTRQSASSACHKENYSVSLLVTEELKQTRRRSPPSQPWMLHEQSRTSRSSQAAWQLEQIHLLTWRTGTTLLQIAQAPQQVPVDQGGKAGTARSQAPFAVAPPPILTAPQPGENLLLYITATSHVVSTAIVV
jgi:hypothetical protein